MVKIRVEKLSIQCVNSIFFFQILKTFHNPSMERGVGVIIEKCTPLNRHKTSYCFPPISVNFKYSDILLSGEVN